MGSRQIVLVSTAGISVHNAGIFWREAKTKRLFSQCRELVQKEFGLAWLIDICQMIEVIM